MKHMRTSALLVGALACASLPACSSIAPGPGTEAVLVHKPWFFGHGGVDPTPIKTGRSWVAWTTSAEYVNVQPQRLDVEFDDLMTNTGVPLDFHAVLSCRIVDSVKLVSGFGNDTGGRAPGWFVRNLEQPFRTAVRDAVKKRDMNEMAITASASGEVDAEVTDRLKALITESGVPVECRDVSLGRANPPDAIKNQRIATAEQEQRVNTEKQRKLAEDQRKEAEAARAVADNAYRNAIGLSPDQFLQLEAIKAQREVCAKGGCTFIAGSATPLVNVGR